MSISYVSLLWFIVVLKNTLENNPPFFIYRCTKPTSDFTKELELMNFFATPGIDVLYTDLKYIDVAIPQNFLPVFYKITQSSKNKTDIITKKLLGKDYYYGSPDYRKMATNNENQNPRIGEIPLEWSIKSERPLKEFLPYESIVNYLQLLEKTFPERIQLNPMETTANNRTVYAVVINSGIVNNTAIFIEGGVIARQWITISAALYIIKEIGTNIDAHPDLKNLDWIIMPLVNPDGYEYSYRYRKFKLWIKNRNCPVECPEYASCGVNLDKNFPYHFSGSGVSYSYCSSMYHGLMALSEPESRSVQSMLQSNRASLKLYIGLRSFGPQILYPWAFVNKAPPDEEDLIQLAKIGADAMYNKLLGLKQTKDNYTIGNYAQMKSASAGIALDYARAVFEIKYSYIIAIRRGTDKKWIYAPEAHEIFPIVDECFQGIKEMAKFIYSRYPPPKSHLRRFKNKRRRRINSAKTIIFNYLLNILVLLINKSL